MPRVARFPMQLPVRALLLVLGLLLAWYLRSQAPPAGTPTGPPADRAPADAPEVEPGGFGSAVGFRSRDRWLDHWHKHGSEFRPLGVRTADAYLVHAQALRDRPAGGDVLERVRADGVVTRFDRATGTFLAVNDDGTIRTCFRPNDGEAYFHRQAEREGP